ncbi:MAG: NOB1 family endonuclease [Aigarchaeota archaeon]|nr:NOB1 family endonuclease [Aigarchaeota archaeon]
MRILDSTAMILGFTESLGGRLITSGKILEESKYGGAEYRALASREGRMVEIMNPDQEYVEEVRRLAAEAGEKELSEADISILALALQLLKEKYEVSIITSDYSIQNLASLLGVEVEPILHRGIKKVIIWATYCGICGWSGDKRPREPCPVCGHPLKRRPMKKP